MIFRFQPEAEKELKLTIRSLISSELGLTPHTNKDFSELSFDIDDVNIKDKVINISKGWLTC